MGQRRRARILAFQALYGWEMNPIPPGELFDGLLAERPEQPLGEDAEALGRLITAGTIENLGEIDRCIQQHLDHWDLSRLARVDLALLRTGGYQLLYMKEIPSRVTIDETVEIAKKYGEQGSFRFINGVLDGMMKHPEN